MNDMNGCCCLRGNRGDEAATRGVGESPKEPEGAAEGGQEQAEYGAGQHEQRSGQTAVNETTDRQDRG